MSTPLKHKAFSTFLNQNPPFELRQENGIRARAPSCVVRPFHSWDDLALVLVL
jgi:hypothetical protein